ncbi:MAG TPA: hypothetical protein PLK37_16875 [Terricaulis sp.]|nr:hypothetical protein [Terricaulis sp.]
MVGVKRVILGALVLAALTALGVLAAVHVLAALAVLAVLFSLSPARAQTADLSGVWVATQPVDHRARGGYFDANLTQDQTGRLSGFGVVDPCPVCAGFMNYNLSWEGGFEADVLVLTGTPARVGGRHTIVRFEGRNEGVFVGVLSGLSGGETLHVIMQRLPPGE